METHRKRGRPATGRGIKIGLYITRDRAAKLGPNPTQAIYHLIDSQPVVEEDSTGFVHISLRLTPANLKAMGVSDDKQARAMVVKAINGLIDARRKKPQANGMGK